MANFKTEFSTRLKSLRTDRRIGIVRAAEEIGITYSAYRGYERGKNMPNAEVLTCICKYYGVSGDYLLGLENDTPLDLVKRQQEKIESLDVLVRSYGDYVAKAKAETIEDFIRRLEGRLANNTEISGIAYMSVIEDINEVCKEMRESENNGDKELHDYR